MTTSATAAQKKTPVWIGYAAVAAVALLIILAWGVWTANRPPDERGGPGQAAAPPKGGIKRKTDGKAGRATQYFIIPWPEDQRDDATMEIDRWPRAIADLVEAKETANPPIVGH